MIMGRLPLGALACQWVFVGEGLNGDRSKRGSNLPSLAVVMVKSVWTLHFEGVKSKGEP